MGYTSFKYIFNKYEIYVFSLDMHSVAFPNFKTNYFLCMYWCKKHTET